MFLQLGASLVPLCSVLAAASQVGDRVDASEFHPPETRDRKPRWQRNVEASVAVQQRRVASVEFDAFSMDDKHRNFGAVFAFVKNLLRFVVVRVELHVCFAERFALSGDDVVTVNAWRNCKAVECVKRLGVVALAAETRR